MNTCFMDRHNFTFNKEDNGGESLSLMTEFYFDVEGGIYMTQRLTLASYRNSASFDLSGVSLTPELLRRLADELEEKKKKILLTRT